MKRRLRQGAQLIVVDPREIALVRTPHVEADYHLQLRPGTNVALFNALAHVVVTEGLTQGRRTSPTAARPSRIASGRRSSPKQRNSPEATGSQSPACPPHLVRGAARLYATARQRRHLLRPRRDRAQPGHHDGDGRSPIWPWPPATSGAKASASIRCAARTTCRARATWARSRTSSAATVTSRMRRRARCSSTTGASRSQSEPGLRIPNMFEAALDGSFKGMYIQGEDPAQSDPNTQHVTAALSRDGVRRRAGPVPERDGQVRAHLLPRLVVPREGRHVHERRAPHLARAQGHGAARRACRTGKSRCVWRTRWAIRCTTTIRRKSWTRSRA